MLRITQRSTAQVKDYFKKHLEKGDYLFKTVDDKQLEIVGTWHGKAADILGLEGTIKQKDFYKLADGITVRKNSEKNRRSAYDFTFSVKKSVSLTYEMTGDKRILEAHRKAVQETMAEIERGVETRIRKKGEPDHDIISGNAVWADFEHYTSRPINGIPDMHLHTHCVLFNATWNEKEGKWKAVQLGNIKRDAPYYEAAYHARLAKYLTDIGYGIEKQGKSWEIKGISRKIVQKFSRRTETINKEAVKRGIVDADTKAELGKKTAEKKNSDYTRDELRTIWRERLGEDDYHTIQSAYEASRHYIRKPDPSAMKQQAVDSLRYALEHELERKSTVDEQRLKATILNHGVGVLSVDMAASVLDAAVEKAGNVMRVEDSKPYSYRRFITTKTVLKEETNMIASMRNGKHSCKSFASTLPDEYIPDYSVKGGTLNNEQIHAIEHVLRSQDRIIGVQGFAGVGKTTLMQKTVEAIRQSGKETYVFAPSSGAAFDVLRDKEGFHNANTVQKLLGESKEALEMRQKLEGNVIWVDEAGLLSSKQMNTLFDIAKKHSARVILSGDTRQHHAVERGDAYRLLQKKGMVVAEVQEILRQRDNKAYKQAVSALSKGEIEKGFALLDDMKAIVEIPQEEGTKGAAGSADYSREKKNELIFEEVKGALDRKESFLVVAPTHAEGNDVTAHLREKMKQEGVIGTEEVDFTTLRNSNLTVAERTELSSYQVGNVVQFNQNVKGVKRGAKLTVTAVDDTGVTITDSEGKQMALPLDKARWFSLYEREDKQFAQGDKVRITRNSYVRDGKGRHRLNNGAIHTIAGITRNGDIELDNGWLLPKDFGHMTHGYVTTSHASQGKTVQHVIISQSSQSFGASDMEQFYVSASRGKKSVKIFTDDKEALLDAVSRSGQRLSATELIDSAKDTLKQRLAQQSRLRRYVDICARKVNGMKQKIPFPHAYTHTTPSRTPSPTVSR